MCCSGFARWDGYAATGRAERTTPAPRRPAVGGRRFPAGGGAVCPRPPVSARQEVAISTPLDEDAVALARITREAAKALDDATQPDVGYPGLEYPDDVADVLRALAHLAGGLQRTLAHLGRFLDEELDAGRLTGPGDSSGAAAVAATRAQLIVAHAAAGQLSVQLDAAGDAVTGTTAAAGGQEGATQP